MAFLKVEYGKSSVRGILLWLENVAMSDRRHALLPSGVKCFCLPAPICIWPGSTPAICALPAVDVRLRYPSESIQDIFIVACMSVTVDIGRIICAHFYKLVVIIVIAEFPMFYSVDSDTADSDSAAITDDSQ